MTDYTILYYEIYECPQCPTDSGRYYGKTPVLELKKGYFKGKVKMYHYDKNRMGTLSCL